MVTAGVLIAPPAALLTHSLPMSAQILKRYFFSNPGYL